MIGILCNNFTLYVLKKYNKMTTKCSLTSDIKILDRNLCTHGENPVQNVQKTFCLLHVTHIAIPTF